MICGRSICVVYPERETGTWWLGWSSLLAASINTRANQSSTDVGCERSISDTPPLHVVNLMKSRYILLACLLGTTPMSFAQSISITVAPPPLVAYEQPPCPEDGYFWSPGYWAYGDDGYFWVPGAWVEVPQPGYLWTPGYWGFADGLYRWHGGYWGPQVGFYGGVNYGYGYYGSGFYGGRWDGDVFRYNTAVWRVNSSVVHNTYVDRTVINNGTANNHVSFNGPGGVEARPTAAQETAARNRHIDATESQRAHEQEARKDRNQHYSVNHGHPNTVVQTNAGERPAAVHHEVAHSQAVHQEAAHPEAVRHDTVRTPRPDIMRLRIPKLYITRLRTLQLCITRLRIPNLYITPLRPTPLRPIIPPDHSQKSPPAEARRKRRSSSPSLKASRSPAIWSKPVFQKRPAYKTFIYRSEAHSAPGASYLSCA